MRGHDFVTLTAKLIVAMSQKFIKQLVPKESTQFVELVHPFSSYVSKFKVHLQNFSLKMSSPL